jgi:hypothetical protein
VKGKALLPLLLPGFLFPGGLSKLEQAATEVDALQKELSQARVVVQAATEECNQLLQVGGKAGERRAQVGCRECPRSAGASCQTKSR